MRRGGVANMFSRRHQPEHEKARQGPVKSDRSKRDWTVKRDTDKRRETTKQNEEQIHNTNAHNFTSHDFLTYKLRNDLQGLIKWLSGVLVKQEQTAPCHK